MAEFDYPTERPKSSLHPEDIQQEWLLMWGANKLREAGHLVDVTLIVQNQKLKPCHRLVLAAGSPYFRAMFTYNVIENTNKEIELKGVDRLAVATIVEYLYTGEVDINDDNVQELLITCSILQVLGLYGKCKRYMESRLGVRNCVEMYTFAKIHCFHELRDVALSMIARRFEEVARSDGFLHAAKEELIDIISADELFVESEEKVYEAVLSWLAHGTESRGQYMAEVLSYVRLALLDDIFLEECIAQVSKLSCLLVEALALEFVDSLHEIVVNFCLKRPNLLMCDRKMRAHVNAVQKYKQLKKSIGTSTVDAMTMNSTKNSSTSLLVPPLEAAQEPLGEQTKRSVEFEADGDLENTSKVADCETQDVADCETQTEDDCAGCPEKKFINFPYFELQLPDCSRSVRIPLTVAPRAGMKTKVVLMFTNGRNTTLLDPVTSHYYCGPSRATPNQTDESPGSHGNLDGLDSSLSAMKNTEVFAMRDGTVYLIGGLELHGAPSGKVIKSRIYIFDVERLVWLKRESLDQPRCMMGVGELDGRLHVTGGKSAAEGSILSVVHRYDFDDDCWAEGPPLPTAIYGHGCASTYDRLYIAGGKTAEKEILSTVLYLDLSSCQWTVTYPLQVPRYLVGMTTAPMSPKSTTKAKGTEQIYVVGGVGNEGPLSSVEILDPCQDKRWKFGESFPGNRCGQTVAFINGSVCAIGGHVTERTRSGRFESLQKYDVFILERREPCGPEEQWTQIVRQVRGIAGSLCACTGLRVDASRIGARR